LGGGGDRELVEQTVLRELSTVLAPAALTATARALADAEAQHRTRLVAFELAVERARYEADRAPPPVRRGRAGEPVGRPHTWNVPGRTSSVRCAAPRPTCARSRPAGPAALTEQELAWVSRAGAGVRKVFDAPSTTYRDRKQLLRAVIAEVVVTLDRAADVATLRIIWQGGDHTDLTMPLTRAGQHTRTTDEDTVALVGRLAASYDDRTIRPDPGQTTSAHRHGAALDPGPGPVAAGVPRHRRLPAARRNRRTRRRRCRRGHDQ